MSDVTAPVSAPAAAPEASPVNATAAPSATPAAAPKAEAAPSTKRKFELMVDGVKEEMELDLSNEAEVKKHLQLSRAGQKRMAKFAEYEKGVQGLIETLKNDPLKVINDPRLKIPEETRRKMAEAIINNEIEEMQKSPEQKEKEQLQRQFEEMKQQVEQEKKLRDDAEMARYQQQAAVQLDEDITSAIATANLPKTARTVQYMAAALMFCVKNDINLSAKDLAPYVRKEVLKDFRDVVSSLPDQEFEEWLGKDQIGRIRKRNLERIKSLKNTASSVKDTGARKKEEKQPEKVDLKSFFGKLGKF